jgi:hypothetical protein
MFISVYSAGAPGWRGMGVCSLVGLLEGHDVIALVKQSAEKETSADCPPHPIHIV